MEFQLRKVRPSVLVDNIGEIRQQIHVAFFIADRASRLQVTKDEVIRPRPFT